MSDKSEIERLIGNVRLRTSPELDQRVFSRLSEKLSQASDEVRPATLTGKATRWKWIVPSLAAGMILLIAGLWWTSQPHDLWAQVVQQVQSEPWMLMRGKTPEGDVEMWFSIPHQTVAVKSPSQVSLTRFKDAVSESYTPQTKRIIRQSLDSQSGEHLGFNAFSILFQGLFGGAEHLDVESAFGHVPGLKTVQESRELVKDNDGTWYDYRITLRADGEDAGTLTFRVNEQTALPTRMTVVGSREPEVTFSIEYPETGPADVYALGVPKDTEVVDATPQAVEGPAKEIVSQMRAAAEKFDDYRAVIVSSDPDEPWHVGSPIVVWKKGLRNRIDSGIVDPTRPPTQPKPDDQTDRREWWRDRCRQLWFRPGNYCDGESTFSNEFVPDDEQSGSFNTHPRTAPQSIWGKVEWKKFPSFESTWPARTSPVALAYPDLSGYFANPHLYNVSLTRSRQNDGQEAMLVKVTWPSGATENDAEYLLDPSRNYVVVRSSTVTSTTENGVRTEVIRASVVLEDFEQPPSGIWYPTTITDEQFIRQKGNVTERTSVSRYDLQFDIELPDSLFTAPGTGQIGIPQ